MAHDTAWARGTELATAVHVDPSNDSNPAEPTAMQKVVEGAHDTAVGADGGESTDHEVPSHDSVR